MAKKLSDGGIFLKDDETRVCHTLASLAGFLWDGPRMGNLLMGRAHLFLLVVKQEIVIWMVCLGRAEVDMEPKVKTRKTVEACKPLLSVQVAMNPRISYAANGELDVPRFDPELGNVVHLRVRAPIHVRMHVFG